MVNMLINKATHVNELAFVSPAWRSIWKIDGPVSEGKIAVVRKDGSCFNGKEIYKKDHILYCLMALGERPESAG